jgi:predicted RNA methylase
LDSNSETNQVQLSSDIFSKHASTLQFGDTGALSHIANTDVGAAANIANAIVASLGGGGTPSAAGASVAGSPSAASAATVDPTLVALAAQLARAQLEANLATANKTIRDSQTPPELTGADPPQKPTAR